ncbi:hypothetical protein F4779DRAFT_609114 [Xylariaceae sp. FL0662B]|nr:hypothetical protein F4779DRAFT_609114 [Xylariaceae sp. FL0662B]
MASASIRPESTTLGRPQQEQITQSDSLPLQSPPEPPPRAPERVAKVPGAATTNKSPSFEFRGFDFFAKRDFNELKRASRAYFTPSTTEKSNGDPPSWLGDATPPATPRASVTRPRGVNAGAALPPESGRSPSSETKIFGVRRSRFWIIVALIGLLLLVAIGVGIGVGVGVGAKASHESGSEVPAVAISSSSSPAVTASASDTSPTSTSQTEKSISSETTTSSNSSPTGGAGGKLDCPAVNGTTYQVPGSDRQFLRLCGLDYSGNGESTDLRQVLTEDMLDCMKNCAGTTNCTGCGWGYLEGDEGSQHKCWLKTGLKRYHEADANWAFAVLL